MAPGKVHDATIAKQPASLLSVHKNAPPASGISSQRLRPYQMADASLGAPQSLWPRSFQ
jgi:hypothetical protein